MIIPQRKVHINLSKGAVKKRGERTHLDFTVSFLCLEVRAKQGKENSPPYPRRKWLVENSSSRAEAEVLIEKFVQVVTDRNQIKLQLHGIQASADHSFIPTVIFEDAESTLGLD